MRLLMVLPAASLAFACTKPVEAVTPVAVAAPEAAEPAHACGGHHEPDDEVAALPGGLKAGDEATCVVMNRKFVLTETTPTTVYEGKAYAFCCDGCKEMFDKDPKKYATLAMK